MLGAVTFKDGPNQGKTLVYGRVNQGGAISMLFVRLNIDGTVDNTYGLNGSGYVLEGSIGLEEAVSVLPVSTGPAAGGILVVGTHNAGTAGSHILMTRFTGKGLLDASFGNGGRVNFMAPYTDNAATTKPFDFAAPSNALIDPQGRILISGSAGQPGTYQGSYGARASGGVVIRFNPNGSLDQTFGSGGLAFGVGEPFPYVYADLALQEDGKIVVVGDHPAFFQRAYIAATRQMASSIQPLTGRAGCLSLPRIRPAPLTSIPPAVTC